MAAYDTMLRSIREDEPPRMSSRLSVIDELVRTAAENRRSHPRNLQYLLRGDLDVIVHKALEKDRARRYQTPSDFADDIQRYSHSEAIEARPASLLYRLRKTAARNRAAVMFVVLLAASLLIGTAVSTFQAIRATNAEDELARQLLIANQLTRDALERTELERWERYRSTMYAVGNAMDGIEDVQLARRNLDTAPREHRGWEWSYFNSRLQDSSLAVLDSGATDHSYCPVFAVHPSRWELAIHQPTSVVFWDPNRPLGKTNELEYLHAAAAVAYSADGKLVAVAGNDHVIRVWNTETEQQLSSLVGHQETVLRLAFHPNGSLLATGGFDHQVCVWDVTTGKLVMVRELAAQCMALTFNADGSHVLITSATNVVAVRLLDNEIAVKYEGPTTEVAVAAVSPDAALLACGTSDPENRVFVWDVLSGELLASMQGHSNQISGVKFNAGGDRIASVSLDTTLRTWDVSTGKTVHVFRGHSAPIYSVAFSPDGKQIVTGSRDETARLWDCESGDELRVFRGHEAEVPQIGFSADGSKVVSASFDGTLRIWDLSWDEGRILRGHTSFVYDVAFDPSSDQVASVAWDGKLLQWDLDAGRPLNEILHPARVVTSVSFDSTGNRLITLSRSSDTERIGRKVMVWDQLTGELLHVFPVAGPNWLESRSTVGRANWTEQPPAGCLIAVGDDVGRVHLFELESGQQRTILNGHEKGIIDVAFRPISRSNAKSAVCHLASSSKDLTVRVWDIERGEVVAILGGHKTDINRVVYSQDGKFLATASTDKTVRLWDADSYRLFGELLHGSAVYGLAFSPDGTRLATGCADKTVRLWDVERRQEVAQLRGHSEYVHAVSYSRDGKRIASASGDATVRIWDSLAPGKRARARDEQRP